MHRQHEEQQAAIHDKLHEIHERIVPAVTEKENVVTGDARTPSD
jgi:hypothetical protein